MFKWVAQKMGVVPTSVQIEEAQAFLEALKKMGDMEVGSISDMVAEYQIAFEQKGIQVSDPIAYIKKKPAIITRFEEFVNDLTGTNEGIKMAAVMVWLHTLRASLLNNKGADGIALMHVAKSIWKEISRGFSDVSGVSDFPKGFGPDD